VYAQLASQLANDDSFAMENPWIVAVFQREFQRHCFVMYSDMLLTCSILATQFSPIPSHYHHYSNEEAESDNTASCDVHEVCCCH
jgi:hypothetical protein